MGAKDRKSSTSPCAHLRAAYHECFNRWYLEKFLKGKWDEDDCISHWEKYKACLTNSRQDRMWLPQIYWFIDVFCWDPLSVPGRRATSAFLCQQHLEDKHLSGLLEEDSGIYSHLGDSGRPTDREGDSQ